MATISSRTEPITYQNVDDRPTGPGVKTIMFIDGIEYDCTEWKLKHPGGIKIMEKYHEKDATDVFYAFHRAETAKMLNSIPQKPATQVPVVDEKLKSFRELRRQLEADGFMERNYGWYTYKTLATYGLCLAGVVLAYTGNWVLSAIVMGIFWQQAGWLGHEFGHHDVFQSRKWNNIFAYLTSNVLMGFSVNWWKDRHNNHHAITNVLEDDPDVDNLPLFLWDIKHIPLTAPKDDGRVNIAKHLVPYQAYYWPLFTPLLRWIWLLQSMVYVRKLKNHVSPALRRTYSFELPLLALHHILVFILMAVTMPSIKVAASWWLLSNAIGGCFIAIIVFTSHYACDTYDPNDRCQLNFVDLQLYTTRNIAPGFFMDWFAGGLNYQIEHHMFPQMPRNRLNECSVRVRKWCAENNVPYQVESFPNCIKLLLQRLAEVGAAWQKQVLQKC